MIWVMVWFTDTFYGYRDIYQSNLSILDRSIHEGGDGDTCFNDSIWWYWRFSS